MLSTRRPRLAAVLIVAAAALAAMPAPASAKKGRNAALLGGLAVGAVGGVLLNQALQGQPAQAAEPTYAPQPAPQPVYVQPAPQPVYVQPAPQPVYTAPAPVAYDPYQEKLDQFHEGCDAGSRRACIQFGMLIGEHKERQAQWRRTHPDYFQWDSY